MTLATKTYEFERQAVEQIKGARERIGAELSKVIVGQEDVIEHLIIAVRRVWPRHCWSNLSRSCLT